jgi:hypothetical protein
MNSPTLAPRGSGLTPTIRFHEHFRISVKKSPSERRRGHASPGNIATVESRHVRRTTTPPAPINRRLPLLNFFSLLFCFVANCSSLLRGNSSCVLAFVASNFLRTFLRYYFFLLTLVSSFHRTSVIYFANFVHERRLYFLLFVLLSNRWLESKVLQDP